MSTMRVIAGPQEQGQPTRDQLREQIREQVRKSVQDAQRAEQQARDAAQRAREAAQTEVIVTTPTPPLPPLPPMEGVTIGQHGQVIEIPSRFGDPNDIPPRAQELAMLFAVVAAFIIVGLPIARAIGRWIDRKSSAPALPSPELAPQLQRIEQAVEAMSIEIERISESQRYLTKLQAGREAEPLALRRGLDNS